MTVRQQLLIAFPRALAESKRAHSSRDGRPLADQSAKRSRADTAGRGKTRNRKRRWLPRRKRR